jgi:hypothetical protein
MVGVWNRPLRIVLERPLLLHRPQSRFKVRPGCEDGGSLGSHGGLSAADSRVSRGTSSAPYISGSNPSGQLVVSS